MKVFWLREVQAILAREDFQSWWQLTADAEKKLAALQAREDELLAQGKLVTFRAELTQKRAIDILYNAGEYDDKAAKLEAESSEIENRSYEAVANFETQRIAVSDLFSRMGALEHAFLNVQSEVRTLKTSMEGVKDKVEREEFSRLLKRKETELARAQQDFRASSDGYERENNRKIRLWEEVEQMWSRSLDVALSAKEYRVNSKRIRQESELLFKEAEMQKLKAEALLRETDEAIQKRKELTHAMDEHRVSSSRLFGCLVGEEFLYFPRRENNAETYCVPIHDFGTGFNIELKAKTIYLINRKRGVEFIEPLPPPGVIREEEDHRIGDFFVVGRKTTKMDAGKNG
jgi:hypothetical protein